MIACLVAGGYLAVLALMYLGQTRLVFPTYLATFSETELPASSVRLCISVSDGTSLAGVLFAPSSPAEDAGSLLLAFGGNIWNVEAMGLRLHRQFPSMHVAAFHYRGYRASGGQPSAKSLLADAVEIHDWLQTRLGPRRMVAIGFSIGTPVAAYLARHRPLVGLILVTPFDSLVELARDHFPWLPVRTLLKHRLSTLDFVAALPTPTAIIVAGRDSVVPARRSEPLRRRVPNLVFHREIAEAEHNDLYERVEFWAALAEAVQAVTKARPDQDVPDGRASA